MLSRAIWVSLLCHTAAWTTRHANMPLRRRQQLASSEEASQPQNEDEPSPRGYVPDGLSAAEYAEITRREAGGDGSNLGRWGSRENPSGPARGDVFATPSLWTDPALFFREVGVQPTPPQDDGTRPRVDDDESQLNESEPDAPSDEERTVVAPGATSSRDTAAAFIEENVISENTAAVPLMLAFAAVFGSATLALLSY